MGDLDAVVDDYKNAKDGENMKKVVKGQGLIAPRRVKKNLENSFKQACLAIRLPQGSSIISLLMTFKNLKCSSSKLPQIALDHEAFLSSTPCCCSATISMMTVEQFQSNLDDTQ